MTAKVSTCVRALLAATCTLHGTRGWQFVADIGCEGEGERKESCRLQPTLPPPEFLFDVKSDPCSKSLCCLVAQPSTSDARCKDHLWGWPLHSGNPTRLPDWALLYSQPILNCFRIDKGTTQGHREIVDEKRKRRRRSMKPRKDYQRSRGVRNPADVLERCVVRDGVCEFIRIPWFPHTCSCIRRKP